MNPAPIFKDKNLNSLLIISLLLMNVSFAENSTGLAYGSKSNTLNLSISCHHSASLNLTAVNSKGPRVGLIKYSIIPRAEISPTILYMSHVRHAMTLLFGVIGNALVLYVVGYLKKMRNPADIYILSLASADLVPSLVMAIRWVLTFVDVKCYNKCGSLYSSVTTAIFYAATCGSAWHLVFISLQRYRYTLLS